MGAAHLQIAGRDLDANALRKEIKAALERLAGEVDRTRRDEGFLEALRTMARFWRYSVCNQFLIWTQRPAATWVTGRRSWKALGREVKPGEAPIGIYHHGSLTDRLWAAGKIDDARDNLKRIRDTGTRVGLGTHIPQVIDYVESKGWDVDFYADCLYNVTRAPEEWRQVLGGELPADPGEVYMQSDPPRMLRTLRQTPKPCFAFKLLAAGRRSDNGADQAFRTAFEILKPTDGIFVGLFPRIKDEVRDNAERVCRILT